MQIRPPTHHACPTPFLWYTDVAQPEKYDRLLFLAPLFIFFKNPRIFGFFQDLKDLKYFRQFSLTFSEVVTLKSNILKSTVVHFYAPLFIHYNRKISALES